MYLVEKQASHVLKVTKNAETTVFYKVPHPQNVPHTLHMYESGQSSKLQRELTNEKSQKAAVRQYPGCKTKG